MGLISDLLGAIGGKKAPRTIADVEAALGRLADERTKARAEIARAATEHDELLLVDGSDSRIGELDVVADKARLVLERVDRVEPLLLRELEELRTEAKRAAWRALRARYDTAALDYANALRVAVEKMTVMLNLNDEAGRAGFESETRAAFIVPVRMVSAEALARYEVEIERAREMGKPAPAPVAAPPKVVAVAPKLKAVSPPPKASPPPKPPFKPSPDPDGNISVVFLKAGYELPDGSRPGVDDVIKLPETVAIAVVKARVAEFEGAL